MKEGIQPSVGNGKWDKVSRWIGPIDLHYHFRSKPLFAFFKGMDRGQKIKVLEFGCGAGANLLALKSRMPAMVALGVDIDAGAIESAKRTAAAKGYTDVHFVCADSLDSLADSRAMFDYVLLIDVLEHLNDPRALLDQAERFLKPDGRILISVPTHRYPRVFGLEFHRAVGHVREGFTLAELDELLGDSGMRTESSYNTGLFAGAACMCFYRGLPKIKIRKLAIAGTIALHLARLVDFFNGPSVSCSIFAVYRRP